MIGKKMLPRLLLAVLTVAGVLLASCDVIESFGPPGGLVDQQGPAPSPTNTSTPTPTVPPPQPVVSVSPTQPVRVMFLAADCPAAGLTVKKASYGLGGLRCMYDQLAEIEITEYPNPDDYQRAFEADHGYRLTAIPQLKDVGKNRQNYNIATVQDDDEGMIYMETYDDSSGEGLCGNGQGTVGVGERFVITVEVNEPCGLADSPEAYSQLITTLRDTALKAITRALAARGG